MGSGTTKVACRFLSTLSSRRATAGLPGRVDGHWDFYPRSPRGERLQGYPDGWTDIGISIHALLAESDDSSTPREEKVLEISIHALLAESDLGMFCKGSMDSTFLSTLSSRRATSSLR